jgi:branched-chain amino acid transport system ATP-binding protein
LAEESADLLNVRNLITGYGNKQVLGGINFRVEAGEIVALIGHNGAGKSTLLKAIFGMLRVWSGEVLLDGEPVMASTPRDLLRSGVALVPQGNRVLNDMTVRENLEVGGYTLHREKEIREGLDRTQALFPGLGVMFERRAGTLSGGEKQMLALAMGLMTSPRLLLLDEPSLGLAPPVVAQALAHIRSINQRDNVAVLIVEQKVRDVLKIAHRVVALRNGQVSFSGIATDLQDDVRLREIYL